jgi:hypothetical protein
MMRKAEVGVGLMLKASAIPVRQVYEEVPEMPIGGCQDG